MGNTFSKKPLMAIIFFLLGAGATVLFGMVAKIVAPAGFPFHAFRNWDVRKGPEGALEIWFDVVGGGECAVEIRRDSRSDEVEFVGVGVPDVGQVFTYEPSGSGGATKATYSGGTVENGMTWIDLDADGRFDQRFDFSNKRMDIRLDAEQWVRATMPDSVAETESGRFTFDAESGEWTPVVAP